MNLEKNTKGNMNQNKTFKLKYIEFISIVLSNEK